MAVVTTARAEALMSPEELAALVGVKVRTLANWRYRGTGPQYIKPGGSVRYRAGDVEAWLTSRTRGGEV